MGGRGSGGHNSKGKLRDVQCARLDVHELARDGKMKLGGRGWLFGNIQFEVCGNPHLPRLVLAFPRRSASGEPLEPILQAIHCYWRNARYGGRYLIFSCSECHRPARVLYARYDSHHYQIWFFTCRMCAGIRYHQLWVTVGTADSDEVARAFRDDVARCSDMMSPGVRCLAG